MDRELLKPATIATTAGFEAVLSRFENSLNNRDIRLDGLVDQLLEYPGLLPRLVAALSVGGFNHLWARTKVLIPDEPIPNGFTQSILEVLLLSLEALFTNLGIGIEELSSALDRHSAFVRQTLPILTLLERHCVAPAKNGSATRGHVYELITPPLESAPFAFSGYVTPLSRQEATRLSARLYRQATTVLKGYLDILRDHRVAKIVENFHLTSTSPDDTSRQEASSEDFEYQTAAQTFSHKKVAVILDTVDDHGSCKLNVSTRFIENMRTSKMRPRLFAKIKAVLRDLSHGILSVHDSIALTGPEQPVSIRSAYLSKHCSMVYYLTDANAAQPEFCIFGIYASNYLEDQPFWDSVAYQIAVREPRSAKIRQELTKPSIEPAVADRIRSLVVLNQYVEFSRPILQRIQDDEEIRVMYELSPQEQEVIDHDGHCYLLGRSGTGKTTIMLFKMVGIEAAWLHFGGEGAMKPRQLFVTRSQHLADKVKEAFARLHETHISAYVSECGLTAEYMWNATMSLPKKFSALEDAHFPLFISFETLCCLLEADLALPTYSTADNDALGGMHNRRLLTYEMFLAQYWNDFPKHLVRGLDSFLVYGEIIGVIQGSESIVISGQQYLDRTTYICRGGRGVNAAVETRGKVYDIYEYYRARRIELGHCDIASRTHLVFKALQDQRPNFLRSIDFLYVDEVQDNLITDVEVLRVLVKNSNGLILAGDTAQTIFAGNAFTFTTLRSFIHDREIGEPFRLQSKKSTKPPAFFKLSANYRSQGGIVACGQTILDLIMQFWPEAIDYIPRETNLLCGTRPYIFTSGKDVNLQQLMSSSSKSIEFGAEQCILVRDEVARDELKARLGDSTIVLTLYESKGLEFLDVLLFNFFHDSICSKAQWDMILSCMDNITESSPPDAVLTELRFLYVAITRAKNRLWIIDQSNSCKSLETLWQRKGEIESSLDLDLKQFAEASAADVWARRGRDFLAERRYSLASQAFRVARLFYEADVAKAFHLREQADAVHPRLRPQALREAGEAFKIVAEKTEVREKRIEYFATSVNCFIGVPDIASAADASVKAELFTKGVVLYRQAAMFKEAMAAVREHGDRVDASTAQAIIYASKLFYFRQLEIQDSTALCESDNDAATFTEIHGLKAAQAAILHRRFHTRGAEAAQLYLETGQPAMAFELCQNGTGMPPARTVAEALWQESKISFGKTKAPGRASDKLQNILDIADLYEEAVEFGTKRNPSCTELYILKCIARGDSKVLSSLRSEIVDSGPLDDALSALLFHSSLPDPTNRILPLATFVDNIYITYRYSLALRSVITHTHDLVQNRSIQLIFGFTPLSPRCYYVYRTGHAADLLLKRKENHSVTDKSLTIEATRLGKILVRFFTSLLQDVVAGVKCLKPDIAQKTVSKSSTQTRITLQTLLYLVLIQNTLRGVALNDDKKIYCLEELYTFFTRSDATRLLASFATIVSHIPHSGEALQVLRDWIGDILHHIPKINADRRATLLFKLAFLGSLFSLRKSSHHLTPGRTIGLNAPLSWHLIHPPRAPTRHQRAHYSVNDLLDGMEANETWALHSAVQFLGHILVRRLPVDIWALCDYLDYIISSLSIATGSTLANMIIPRSTAPLVLQNMKGLEHQEMYALDRFLQFVQEIIQELLFPETGDTLRVDEKLLTADSPERVEAIIRICQGLGILGFNVDDYLLRQKLLDIIALLRRPEAKTAIKPGHVVYSRFAEISKWAQLLEATRSSASVVRVILKDGSEEYNLSYSRWRDDTSRRNEGREKAVNPKAAPAANEPGPKPSSSTKAEESMKTVTGSAEADERPHKAESAIKTEFRLLCAILDDSPFPMHSPTDMILVGRLAEAMTTPLPTGAEIMAARTIQSFVRRSLRRARPVAVSGLSYAVRRRFEECRERLIALPCPTRQKRLLFLGPLPHALACLDALNTYFNFQKDNLAAKLQEVGHIDLEEAGAKVARAHERVAETRKLLNVLRPSSDLFHAFGAVYLFKSYVRKIGKLIQSIKNLETREEFEVEWELIFKSVLYPEERDNFIR